MRKVFAALLVTALLVGAGAVAVDAQSYFQKFENLWSKTLTVTGDASIGDDMTVAGDMTVGGTVSFDTSAADNLESTGDTTVGENLTVSGTSNLVGNVNAGGTLNVVGASSLASLAVTGTSGLVGNVNAGGTLNVVGASSMASLAVTGTSNLIGNANAGGTLNVVGASTLASLSVTGTTGLIGNVDVTGNLEVIDFIGNSGQEYYFPGDAIAVADGSTITPTTALVELTAAGTVGASLSNPCTEGQFVMFVNTAAQTITITDTGTIHLASNWAGGEDDTLTVTCIGVSWFEMARSVN